MKLAICGDSWFTSDLNYPNQSFGEILSQRNQWELISLARGGCSNFAIALQINKAIELNADAVVIGATTADRIEIPIRSKNIGIWNKLKDLFSWQYWFDNPPSVYVRERGLSNIHYYYSDLSSKHPFMVDPTVVSESMNNLAFGYNRGRLDQEQLDTLKLYMLNLYDNGIKKQVDSWIISDACRRLISAGIPFLIFLEGFENDTTDFDWIPRENIVLVEQFQFGVLPRSDAQFHYCPDLGAPVFANYIESRLTNLKIST